MKGNDPHGTDARANGDVHGGCVLDAARDLLARGCRPVVIYPAGFDRGAKGPASGKEPFGKGWGLKPVTPRTLANDVRYFAVKGFTPGVGICLGPGRGPGGSWLIDVEGDGPEAEESRAKLYGGEAIETMGWGSFRGGHRLLIADGERLPGIVARLKPFQVKDANQPGVFHIPALPGLELRIGGYKDDGTVKQLQSVVPPTPGTDGTPRRWNGVEAVADVPEAFYRALETIVSDAGAGVWTFKTDSPKDRVEAWFKKTLENTYGAVALAPEGSRHPTLMARTRTLAGYLHYHERYRIGFSEDELEAVMIKAADEAAPERNGDNPRCVRDAIDDGKKSPLSLPGDLHRIAVAGGDSTNGDEHRRAGNSNGAAGGGAKAKPSEGGAVTAAETSPDLIGLSDAELGITSLADVKERPVDWLWKYRLERGGLALMAGDAGIGKSQVLLAIASAVSTGGDFPDGSKAPQGDVVIVAAEDRPETTIKPRLLALGADLSRITIVKAKYVLRPEGKEPVIRFASFQDHAYWKEVFRRRPNCLLFIADPIPSYLGRGVNDSKNREIREVLEPFLDEVIEPAGICMWGNTHLNKSVDAKSPIHRITGSIAYGALPRNVHFVVRDPEDPQRRFCKQAKANDAPDDLSALAFRVERREIDGSAGEIIETAIPVFDAEGVAIDLQAMVNGKPGKRGFDPVKTTALAEWLFDHLHGRPGWTERGDVFAAAGEAGLIGTFDEDKRLWSNGGAIYRAKKSIPNLPPPRDGKRIEEQDMRTERDRYPRMCFKLIDADAAY